MVPKFGARNANLREKGDSSGFVFFRQNSPGKWSASFALLGNGSTIARPWNGAQAFRRNDVTCFLTEAVDAVADPFQGAVDFEEFIVFRCEFGPQHITTDVFA